MDLTKLATEQASKKRVCLSGEYFSRVRIFYSHRIGSFRIVEKVVSIIFCILKRSLWDAHE